MAKSSFYFRQWLYNGLIHSGLPIIAAISWRKCHQAAQEQPQLKNCFAAKFGAVPSHFKQNGLLIHAVSLGETLSVLPFIKQLQQTYPELPVTLTNGSVRGARQLVKTLPNSIQYSFLPQDYPFAVRRFLKQLAPKAVVIIETEIWPNLIQVCHELQIPIFLANARLKASSMENYRKYGGDWLKDTLNQFEAIACQFKPDYDHFRQLGIKDEKLTVMGNLKFDLEITEGQRLAAEVWKRNNLQTRFCWVAASTHENEEAILLQAHKALLKQRPDAVLILVPRQADRFAEVETLLQTNHWNYQKRSDFKTSLSSGHKEITTTTQVLLADSVGEMLHWMAICDTAFIGGSLVPFGGHNILEPAIFKKPVLSGPHFQNLAALYQVFIDQKAISLVENSHALSEELNKLATAPEYQAQMGRKAYQAFQSQTGALNNLLKLLQPYLP